MNWCGVNYSKHRSQGNVYHADGRRVIYKIVLLTSNIFHCMQTDVQEKILPKSESKLTYTMTAYQ